jgi:hypothetical protein
MEGQRALASGATDEEGRFVDGEADRTAVGMRGAGKADSRTGDDGKLPKIAVYPAGRARQRRIKAIAEQSGPSLVPGTRTKSGCEKAATKRGGWRT